MQLAWRWSSPPDDAAGIFDGRLVSQMAHAVFVVAEAQLTSFEDPPAALASETLHQGPACSVCMTTEEEPSLHHQHTHTGKRFQLLDGSSLELKELRKQDEASAHHSRLEVFRAAPVGGAWQAA